VAQLPELNFANVEAERALLGSVLLDNSALELAKDLQVRDFFSEAHRTAFRHMLELNRQGKAIDLVTLCEELKETGEMEKAGGAAYLAALTDGVPIGTSVAVLEYVRIVQKRSKRRDVVELGQKISERAAHDPYVTVEQQAGEAAAALQQVAGEAPAKSAKRKLRYPLVPPEAWHPAAEIYRQAVTRSSEASDNWHYICFYTMVGAALGRSLFNAMGGGTIYSNMYSILLGLVGGDGKDTAINFSLSFLQLLEQQVYITSRVDSEASFILNWQNYQMKQGPKAEDQGRAILRLVEMKSLLEKAEQSGTKSIVTMMVGLYDCPEKITNESIQTPAEVHRPTLCGVMGSAIRWMRPGVSNRGLAEADIVSGLGRRFVFVPGEKKPPMNDPPDIDREAFSALAKVVKGAVDYWQGKALKRVELSRQAKELWRDWYKKWSERAAEDDMIGALTVGDRLTTRKVALINAGIDQADAIEEKHLAPALAFGEFLYNARYPVFLEHGISPMLEIENRMVELVKEAPGGRMSKRTLQQNVRRVDAKTFNERLHALCMPDGPLRQMDGSGRVVWVIYNEP